jgi:hypothetical protein
VAAPRKWNATELGDLLAVTRDERRRLGITTIGYAGSTPADRRAASRQDYNDRRRRRRHARGTKPQTRVTKVKPWLSLQPPISQATYYRRHASCSSTLETDREAA